MRTMIFGTHLLLFSSDPEADRAFFRDVLGLANVDSGGGWLIFALPPAEMGIHPAESSFNQPHAGQHLASGTLYLMCDKLTDTLNELASRGVEHTEIRHADWGMATSILLPGGTHLGLYEPSHTLALRR